MTLNETYESIFTKDLIFFIFSLIVLIFLIIVRKQDTERINSLKLYIIIGLSNMGILIFSFIYTHINYFYLVHDWDFFISFDSFIIYQLAFNSIIAPIIRILTFGVILAFIGLKNGAEKDGYFLIISGIFFTISQIFFIYNEISYYIYLISPYGTFNFSSISVLPSIFFTVLGYIYLIKFSNQNQDSFRTFYGILGIIILFLPVILNLADLYY